MTILLAKIIRSTPKLISFQTHQRDFSLWTKVKGHYPQVIPQPQNNRDYSDMQVNHRLYCVAVIPHSLEDSVYTCSVVLSWFISFRLGLASFDLIFVIRERSMRGQSNFVATTSDFRSWRSIHTMLRNCLKSFRQSGNKSDLNSGAASFQCIIEHKRSYSG